MYFFPLMNTFFLSVALIEPFKILKPPLQKNENFLPDTVINRTQNTYIFLIVRTYGNRGVTPKRGRKMQKAKNKAYS